jgi:uncharacterized membrane protein
VLLSTAVVVIPAIMIDYFIEGTNWFENFLLNVESIVIGGPVSLGVTWFTLALFRRGNATPSMVFSGFEFFSKAVLLRLIMTIFIILWSLLLVVPGIIAAIRYSQAYFVLAEDPSKSVMQCIEESKWLMVGNKWKYFCLMFSFIGWAILAAIPAGLGYIWLIPYVYMTQAAFFELVAGNLKPDLLEENVHEY